MIFTQEQIKRLPGSRVRLRNGTVCTVDELEEDLVEFMSFYCDKDGLNGNGSPICLVEVEPCEPSNIDIVEVLEWADEKHEAQTEPATSGNITTMGFHKVAGVETDPNGFNCLCPLETLRQYQRKHVQRSKIWWAIEKTLALASEALSQRAEKTAARLDEVDRLRKAARLGLPHARGE